MQCRAVTLHSRTFARLLAGKLRGILGNTKLPSHCRKDDNLFPSAFCLPVSRTLRLHAVRFCTVGETLFCCCSIIPPRACSPRLTKPNRSVSRTLRLHAVRFLHCRGNPILLLQYYSTLRTFASPYRAEQICQQNVKVTRCAVFALSGKPYYAAAVLFHPAHVRLALPSRTDLSAER